ncbi:hypothetical protein [Alsobacter sp. R-9]
MARSHILLMQAQDILWRKGYWTGARPEVKTRTLPVEDDATAAALLDEPCNRIRMN